MNEPIRDYLWDKSGTPDQEIERLESLLAQFLSDPQLAWIHEPLPDRAERTSMTDDGFGTVVSVARLRPNPANRSKLKLSPTTTEQNQEKQPKYRGAFPLS